MLDRLNQQPADALLALIKLFDADPRADKIDLGVGVYRTDDGATPVFAAVKAAEKKLLTEQDSKAYLGPEGDMGFVHALMPYVFGAQDPSKGGRIDGMQAPGGTGGLRLAFALAKRAGINRIITGSPTWPNHPQILADLGMEAVNFNHALPDGTADLEALRAAVANAQEGDAILLHGCCHNPSGIDYTPAQWDEIVTIIADAGILPIIDLAYQGLGQGMEDDAAGMRKVLAAVPEALICYSCDKNFGLYRERVGALYVMGRDADETAKVLTNGHILARVNWSQPPDHGAAAARIVLEDAGLTKQWLAELDAMRDRMREMRDTLAAADNRVAGLDLTAIATQNGLFSILNLNKDQILAIREKHGVYMAGSGRINVAGLTRGNIGKFIEALADVAG
ncbi:putative aromatic-amino-acid transaminase [Caenibius tardaugens NBRC 16725]|uniref:Putative aromatic-amino-acid transaminase n=1 Tax=Caenibius tardaugens NBRC 16725 TaxID=1219035 RepID=U2Y780_9SPHN|nr:aromatic amino acid transaminase [Caenibius tardaugens]GAD49056.1 putative aromatic-amino-acid transaminase [Caenibius tardaugens NBRC 16725]